MLSERVRLSPNLTGQAFGHNQAQEESPCEAWKKMAIYKSMRTLRRNHLDLGLPASTTVRRECHADCGTLQGSPNKLIQGPTSSQFEKSFPRRHR